MAVVICCRSVIIKVVAVSIFARQSLTAFSAFLASSVKVSTLLRLVSHALRSSFKAVSFCSPSLIIWSSSVLRMVVDDSRVARTDGAKSSSVGNPHALQASAALASALATVWSLSKAMMPWW